MRCVQPLSFKTSAPPRAITAVVATPLFGRRQQRSCSTEFYGWRSQSSYPKLPSISPRDLQRSVLPAVSHIPRAAKDDDDAQPAAAAEPYMPEVWPDFSKMKVDPDIEDTFFNRKEEYASIVNHLNGKPKLPLMLLGPVNSGKSALLTSLLEQEKSRVLYLNCGLENLSSPELMAEALRNQARTLPSQWGMRMIKTAASKLSNVSQLLALGKEALSVAAPGEEVLNAFMADFFPKDSSTDLTAIINTYKLLLENMPPRQKKPIIVIDEVNALKRWKTKDEEQLTSLLEFLKRICKEKKLSQIVLSSSDFFMVSWLRQKGFGDTQRRVEVLGDLTSAEAFVYVCGGKVGNRKGHMQNWPGLMAQSEQTIALGMTREDWKKVWSVCGGNMHLLKVCVDYARQYNSWDEGVAETLSEPQDGVATALDFPHTIPAPTGSSGPRIWGAKHYKAVLRLIAANPYHAVRRREVHAALEKVGIAGNVLAADVLLSMVEFNVLSLRPYSKMAKDIPREAFFKEVWGVEEKDNVVTMPSPAHLAAVLILETKFQKEDEESAKNPKGIGQGNN